MAYNTGNPLGSSDPKDLFDNADNLDKAMNSTAESFLDRFGRERVTYQAFHNLAINANAQIAATVSTAQGQVNQARTNGINSINSTVSAANADVAAARDDGVSDISDTVTAAGTAVNNSRDAGILSISEKVGAVESSRLAAVDAISEKVDDVNDASSSAATTIAETVTAAGATVNDARDGAVTSINGKVVDVETVKTASLTSINGKVADVETAKTASVASMGSKVAEVEVSKSEAGNAIDALVQNVADAGDAAESQMLQTAASLGADLNNKHYPTFAAMVADPQSRDAVVAVVDADTDYTLNGWYYWDMLNGAWAPFTDQPVLGSAVDTRFFLESNKVAGDDDLLLDSQSGLLMSSLQERSRSAGIFIVGDEEKLTFDTLYNRVRFGFEISKQVDILEGAEGHNDRRAFPEIQTLPDSTQALIFLKKDGTAALTVDTVNNKLTTDFSFESNVEQRPPTVFVDVPPRIERNTADPLYRLSGRVYQATATIARTGPSRFWTAWRADNTNAAEVPGNFTVMAYSDDDCETVTEYGYLTYSPAGPDKHMVDPMLWLDPAGRLWLFFGCMGNNKGFDGVQGTWAIICQNPNAQFPVWGQAFRLSYYGDPRRPIEVNGQWYIALDGWRHSASSPLRYMDAAGPHIHRIDWQRQKLEHISQLPPNNGSSYSGFFETEFMQRSDGSVLALCRSLSASVETKFSVSTDLMKTWSAWADYTVISPSSSSRMWLGRSPSGRTVFCWNNDTVRRTLTLGISDDDGATYPYKVVLEPNETGQVTYPIVAFGDGGAIYVIYDNERTSGKRQIRIAKVIESEIVAGTSVPVVNIVSNPFA